MSETTEDGKRKLFNKIVITLIFNNDIIIFINRSHFLNSDILCRGFKLRKCYYGV